MVRWHLYRIAQASALILATVVLLGSLAVFYDRTDDIATVCIFWLVMCIVARK